MIDLWLRPAARASVDIFICTYNEPVSLAARAERRDEIAYEFTRGWLALSGHL